MISNSEKVSYEQAGEYLRLTLKYLSQYKLAASLINLIVFYEYSSGLNQELQKAIDTLTENENPISSDQIRQIYDQYFKENSQVKAAKLLEKIKNMIKELAAFFTDTADSMEDQGKRAEDLALQIKNIEKNGNIYDTIDQMLAAVTTLIESNKNAYSKLKSSAEDISRLRSELEQVNYKANTDALTGLFNRRAFEEKLKYERISSLETNCPLSIMMIDIDSFKVINDTYGHLTGDNLLKKVAAVVGQSVRKSDFSARLGGDEICVIMPDTDLSGACSAAIKIKNIITRKSWYLKETQKEIEDVTISVGISQYSPGESQHELYERADKALYLAKASGRNNIKTQNDL